MRNKDYDFPLFTLDLIPGGMTPPDDARFFIPSANGRLMVRRTLRLRGQYLSTGACTSAITMAFSYLNTEPGFFNKRGFNAGWQESMLHWRDYINDQERGRTAGEVHHRLAQEDLQRGVREAQDLWRQLGLAAELSGLGGTLVKGRAPRSALDLVDALPRLAILAAAPGTADVLEERGFGREERDRLRAIAALLSEARDSSEERLHQQKTTAAALMVARGAICGDLTQLCRAAQRSRVPRLAERFQVQRLFPSLARRPRSPAAAPSAPAALPPHASTGAGHGPAL